jgi:hypothetical protein
MLRLYVWMLCYAPRWVIRLVPMRWKRRQAQQWLTEHLKRGG